MNMLYKHNTSKDVIFKMVDPSTGAAKTGLTSISFEISRNGATFSSITPTVTEIGRGFYKFADGHGTMGKVILSAWQGIYRGEEAWQVVSFDPEGLLDVNVKAANGATGVADGLKNMFVPVFGIDPPDVYFRQFSIRNPGGTGMAIEGMRPLVIYGDTSSGGNPAVEINANQTIALQIKDRSTPATLNLP